ARVFDATTPDGTEARIIAAALRLAAERPWGDVKLLDIAAGAGVTLVDMRRSFGSKSAILAAFARTIDDQVLAKAVRPPAGQSARDTLFEVVMSRFDALEPHRAALRSIHAAGAADPALLRALLASQAWMLAAAGVDTDGLGGGVRVAGLASVYASVFATWLEDDDPGLARTMASLDRRLRRGEQTLSSLDEMAAAARRMATIFSPWSRRASSATATNARDADIKGASTTADTPPSM
ncbi:MAG: TetR family transcriptional regulator, partial [Hyphomicrobium sp.]